MNTTLCLASGSLLALLGIPGFVLGANCSGSGLKTSYPLPATLTVQRDAPVGTVLHDSGGWVGGGQASARCSGFGTFWLDLGFTGNTKATGLEHVYETGVPGVGIKVAWNNNPNSRPAGMDGGIYMTIPRSTTQISRDTYAPAQRWWIQLIKTGPIASGTYQIAPIRNYYHNLLTNELVFPASQVIYQKRGCRLQNSSLDVRMAKAQLRDFTGPGSTARPTNFQIPLECDPDLRLSYSLDAPLKASPSVVHSSDTRGTARGVGVQLLKDSNGAPVVFGEKVFYTALGPDRGALLNIPLTARYYQLDTEVVPGTVEALVHLTLYYE